ncbi:hypothetical protein PVAP13_3NG196000 [Panicum virgatum]|uniref:Uncharacterized protein n=1 Tax=Panicum virgatum TaxID=38727 RepID=A0A8T0UGD6_PANVG|nr:hypothetical protein PVAP13_3NG196000 [Panicum virgatum]
MDVNSDAMAQRRPLAACPGQARAPAISACCIHSPVILFIKWMNNLKVYKELICVQEQHLMLDSQSTRYIS